MKTGVSHLYIPGPTVLPERVRRALARPMEDHRAPDFPSLLKPLLDDLKKVVKTETGRVFLFPGSGTGAWEAAMTNTLSPGDKILIASFGQFSMLWAQMGRDLGLQVECVERPWGEGAPVEMFQEILEADKAGEIKAVLVTQNETATGVTSDVAGVRRAMDAAGHDALLFVDGVSSIASIDFRMDEWGVDLAVSGSQKGLMLPAGLGVLAVSEKAMAKIEDAKCARSYFDIKAMAKLNDEGFFPYTPPAQLLHGLQASLELIFEEGLETIFARHHRLAEGVRRAVHAWGLRLCAAEPKWWSDTVSAIVVPEDVDAREVLSIAYDRYNTSFGAGLNVLSGKVFRIGHLGDLNEGMCLTALGVAEMALRDAGAKLEYGSGVGAAQAYYAESRQAQIAIAAE